MYQKFTFIPAKVFFFCLPKTILNLATLSLHKNESLPHVCECKFTHQIMYASDE